jgi:hypothetical protein
MTLFDGHGIVKHATHLVLTDVKDICLPRFSNVYFTARNWSHCDDISKRYDAVETIEKSQEYQNETERAAKERYENV